VAGNESGVKTMMKCLEGTNVGKTVGFMLADVSGNGLLQIAALNNYIGIFKELLNAGFDINAVDSNHGTALQAAIYMDNDKIFEEILKACKQTNGTYVKLAKVNTKGGYYGCALQVAAFKASEPFIRALLNHGADRNACIGKSKYGTALQAAARTGSPQIVKLILDWEPATQQGRSRQRVDVNTRGGVYETALQAAAKGGYTAATDFLRHISRGRVLRQDTNIPRHAKQFFEDGKQGRHTVQVLRNTSQASGTSGSPAAPATVLPDYLEVAKILLRRGAKVSIGGGRLGGPLNAAASSGQLEMLEELLNHDDTAEEHRPEVYGRALISAITQECVPNTLPLVTILRSRGAKIDFVPGECVFNRPLTAAAAKHSKDVVDVVEYLVKSQNEISKKDFMNAESGIYGSALRAALTATPKPDTENALHAGIFATTRFAKKTAWQIQAEETAIYLIKEGADITTRDELYGNVLHLAAFANFDNVVRLLVEKHVDINVIDDNCQTALHIASYLGYERTVTALVELGAAIELRDAWGATPLDIVEEVMERESHPGPSLNDLRKIKQILLEKSTEENKPKVSGPFHGPSRKKRPQSIRSEQQRAKSVYASPKWNPGLNFQASVVDFLEKDEEEYVLFEELPIDDLLYRKGAIDDAMKSGESCHKRSLRWFHLPANNVSKLLNSILYVY
jgi:ankyrin repeat protein